MYKNTYLKWKVEKAERYSTPSFVHFMNYQPLSTTQSDHMSSVSEQMGRAECQWCDCDSGPPSSEPEPESGQYGTLSVSVSAVVLVSQWI